MDNQELRIGNIVSEFEGMVAPLFVAEIKEDYVRLISRDKQYGAELPCVFPIAITAYLLKLFGFTNMPIYKDQYQLGEFLVIAKSEYWVLFKGTKICEIKYIHQIQNLYLTLTGKELEIKNQKIMEDNSV